MLNLSSIKLDKESEKFLYMQLYDKIREMILDGSLKPDTKLPTIRKLSEALDVNNVTVVNAYNKLEADGYIYKKVGSGSYINRLESPAEEEAEEDDSKINFANTAPTPSLFPIEEIRDSIIEVLDNDKSNAFVYQDIKGYLPLRVSLKGYLENQGIFTHEDNIQIISGAQQGIDIISKALVNSGDVVFTEKYTYTGAIGVFRSRGAQVVGIEIGRDGIDIDDLEMNLEKSKPKFLYIMPNFQNPTGCSYSKEKMERIIELAREHDFYIIEDDYLSDLTFGGKKNTTMKSLDSKRHERVIYVKSFSKLFMPGLRIAFIVIPKEIYLDVLSAKHISDISTPGLIQRSFYMYMKKGNWDENLRRINKVYDLRYRVMVSSVEKHMPAEVEYTRTEGGSNFWFRLPDGYSSNDLYEYLLGRNIIVAPGKIFDVDGEDNAYFRLSITSMDSEKIEGSVKSLAESLRSFLRSDGKGRFTVEEYNQFL